MLCETPLVSSGDSFFRATLVCRRSPSLLHDGVNFHPRLGTLHSDVYTLVALRCVVHSLRATGMPHDSSLIIESTPFRFWRLLRATFSFASSFPAITHRFTSASSSRRSRRHDEATERNKIVLLLSTCRHHHRRGGIQIFGRISKCTGNDA